MSDQTDAAPATESTDPRDALQVTPRVLVFFDYACQFCYLDWPRFKRLRREHDAELVLVPFELRPTLPAEGVDIGQLGGGHSEKVVEHMKRMATEGGVELTFPEFVPNTHYALALGEFARDLGPEAHEAVHDAIFEAYNARGEDIGSEKVLLRIADERALDPAQVLLAFADGRYDARLHQFHHLALAFGVNATPSALICNELFIGSRPYKVLEQAIDGCLIDEHNISQHMTVVAQDPSEGASAAVSDEGAPATIDR
jgi:predicted DsbA family dithiol-disulfide isomerase